MHEDELAERYGQTLEVNVFLNELEMKLHALFALTSIRLG